MQWFQRFRFSGGIHPHYHKDRTRYLPVKRLPFPGQLILPLDQHIGAPAEPIVRQRESTCSSQVRRRTQRIRDESTEQPEEESRLQVC